MDPNGPVAGGPAEPPVIAAGRSGPRRS